MFEVGKTYKTRGGLDARVIYTDLKNDDTIVAIITNEYGNEDIKTFMSDGQYFRSEQSNMDLIPDLPPVKLEVGKLYKRADGKRCFVIHLDTPPNTYVVAVEHEMVRYYSSDGYSLHIQNPKIVKELKVTEE